jgi:hypothetical protein
MVAARLLPDLSLSGLCDCWVTLGVRLTNMALLQEVTDLHDFTDPIEGLPHTSLHQPDFQGSPHPLIVLQAAASISQSP